MNFAVVQDLDSKQRNWLAEVMVGIITIDGKVDDTELPYLQKAMELVESRELKEKLLSVARLEKKVRVHSIQLDGELAFEMLKLLAGIMIVDGRLLPSEINFFYEVGHRLGLPDKALEKLWKTARREMEDRCPRAVARLGEEARVIALQQINLERATFRYHRPVVKGAHVEKEIFKGLCTHHRLLCHGWRWPSQYNPLRMVDPPVQNRLHHLGNHLNLLGGNIRRFKDVHRTSERDVGVHRLHPL